MVLFAAFLVFLWIIYLVIKGDTSAKNFLLTALGTVLVFVVFGIFALFVSKIPYQIILFLISGVIFFCCVKYCIYISKEIKTEKDTVVLKKWYNKRIILLIVILVLIVIYVCYFLNSKYFALYKCARDNGLKGVVIIAHNYQISDYTYKIYDIKSDNFDSFTPEQMLDIDKQISQYAVIDNYICKNDRYSCDYSKLEIKRNNELYYSNYIQSKTYQKEIEDELRIHRFENSLPFIEMREECLHYTILGEPDEIEHCPHFESLMPRARSTTYIWHANEEHGYYRVLVRYRYHFSNKVNDYTDLPSNNGYVESIDYIDDNGIKQSESYIAPKTKKRFSPPE